MLMQLSGQTQVGATNKNPINLCPRHNKKEIPNKFKKTENATAVPIGYEEGLKTEKEQTSIYLEFATSQPPHSATTPGDYIMVE